MIIVFGGAFNPPTNAHLAIYDILKKTYQPSRMLFLPVGDMYHKTDLASCHHRLAMLKLLFENEPSVDVLSLECDQETFKGTFHSLNHLQKHYSEPLVYVIGADHLEGLKHWLNADRLIKQYRFIVLNRGQKDLERIIQEDAWLQQHKARFELVSHVDFPLAATDYRAHRQLGVVPARIEAYIKTHQLYTKEVR